MNDIAVHVDGGDPAVRPYFVWPAKTCAACPLRERCVSKKNRLARRTIEVAGDHMALQERRGLCKTPGHRERMHRRNAVEGTHSEPVRGYGLRRCRYKGGNKTGLQARFTAAACTLRRWARRLCREERKMA
jgi:IS5 family transposase